MSIASIASILAVDSVADRPSTVRYTEAPPMPVSAPVDLKAASRAHGISDVYSSVRRADQVFGKGELALVQEIKSLQTSEMSMASLTKLQMRVIVFKAHHEALTGVVTNLNQSLKTVLNAG
jgi:hypothetical protein